MKIATLSLFILCRLACQAQNERAFHVTEFLSGHFAYLNFKGDVIPDDKFPSTELKAGACLIKPFGKHFELRSRIGYGVKLRRSPSRPQIRPGKYAYPLALIYRTADKMLATQDNDFLDIPVILHYKMLQYNFGIEVGFTYRLYGFIFNAVDYLNFDYGPLCNLTYAFKYFSVFCGFTMGMKSTLNGAAHHPDENNNYIITSWKATNNYFQWGIEYNLFKKLKKKGIRFPRVL